MLLCMSTCPLQQLGDYMPRDLTRPRSVRPISYTPARAIPLSSSISTKNVLFGTMVGIIVLAAVAIKLFH